MKIPTDVYFWPSAPVSPILFLDAMKKIILASSSPRRADLLRQLGLIFEIEPANYEENMDVAVAPLVLAREISAGKATAVAAGHQNALVIAADTFGVLNGKILGKPHSRKEAREMLASLSGKSHTVITGLTVVDADTGKTVSRTVETEVRFRSLTPAEIDAYVETGEPFDKAGAYAVQGKGALLVQSIKGDYYNVVGLPLVTLAEALKDFGVRVL